MKNSLVPNEVSSFTKQFVTLPRNPIYCNYNHTPKAYHIEDLKGSEMFFWSDFEQSRGQFNQIIVLDRPTISNFHHPQEVRQLG
jgi:hypothetical protein